MENLKKLIDKKEARICVVGLGYVGLPLACVLAKNGFRVIGADIRKEIVEKVNAGKSPISENGIEEVLSEAVKTKRLYATTNPTEAVKESEAVFIVVQTPIDENKKPELSAFKSACRAVAKGLKKGMLVISESTVPPGTMKNIAVPILEESGLKAGKDFYLAYSPERAIPTKTLEEIQKNSRIIGGINKESAELAALIYAKITSGEIVTDELAVVEMVKLIENTYRDVNIALANEIALFCEKHGIDTLRAIELANKHPRVHLHYPGAGVGGHCIPKDPYFLLDRAKKSGIELKLISTAREINENMPEHMLRKIEKALSSINKSVKDSKIAVLGIAYKGDTCDVRGTPSKKVIEALMAAKANVFSHDPFVTQDFGGKFSNDLKEVISSADCIVIMTDHSEYKKLELKKISSLLNKPCVIVDGRRVLNPKNALEEGFGYFGIGY